MHSQVKEHRRRTRFTGSSICRAPLMATRLSTNWVIKFDYKLRKTHFFFFVVVRRVPSGCFHYSAKCALYSDEFSRTNTITQRHVAICSLFHHIITEFELVALVVARTPTSIKIVSFFFSSLLLFSIRSIRDRWSWFRTAKPEFRSVQRWIKQYWMSLRAHRTDAQSIWPHSVSHSHSS